VTPLLDNVRARTYSGVMLQLSVKNRRSDARRGLTLMDLRRGEAGILDRLDLPEADARRLMELGFLPGSRITAALSAPGGDPRVFEVDGSEVALRRETALCLRLRPEPGALKP
jgi:ferrous iron transport protein A